MTSFNTGATNSANTASSITLAIPAGVNVGDVMIMALEVFTETGTTPTISFSGAGGGWTLVPMTTGTNPEVATAGSSIWSYGFAYYRVATAGDQGATLTITESGSAAGTTWFAVAMGAYSGANTSSPIDVAFGNNAQGTASATAPSGNTVTAGDWAIHLACVGINGTSFSGPGTSRENITSSASVGAAIDDSNGSVGGGGTSIGGGTWTQTGNATDWWSLFEIGLAPPSAGVSGKVQPRATVPVPRTRPARAVWAAIRGAAYVAVPAPVQQYRLAPRRAPSRAVWARSRPFTGFVSVAAPRQEPYLPPRRKPARAVVGFTPVTTTNAPPPVSAAPPKPPLSLPRRAPARAVWRGGAGQAFVFVPAPAQGPPRPRSPAPRRAVWRAGPVPGVTRPAPRQPPQTVYRRGPARAYVRFTPVVTVNATGVAVAAPRQLTTIPRRKPARAYVRFTPVTTTNPAFIPTAVTGVPPDDKPLVKRRIIWRMLGI